MPSSPSTHQDSPKVPERPWPQVVLRRWSHAPPDHIVSYSVLPPDRKRPVGPGKREAETYIPLSALLSDEVVEAAAVSLIHSHRGEAQSSKRPVGEQAREHYLPIAREALQAAVEQVGGAR